MSDLFDALAPGTRVVVRHRLPDGGSSDALGEFLGVLQHGGAPDAPTDRSVRVLTRRGEVRIPVASITHAKPVPPPPARRPAPGAGRGVGHRTD